MNLKEAKENIKKYGESHAPKSVGYLAALSGNEVGELVEALDKFRTDFKSMEMQQKRKLVLGQTLETASKNWEEFPEMLSLDLEPLFKALAKFKSLTSVRGEGGNV